MSLIPLDRYKDILKTLPIFCADIILQNSNGEYLLIKRNNEPKKDQWWVIGGRVLRGESMEEAAKRKVSQETGLEISGLTPVGYFELIDGINPFDFKPDYHTISVVFTATIDGNKPIKLDNQSKEYKFSKDLPKDFVIKGWNK